MSQYTASTTANTTSCSLSKDPCLVNPFSTSSTTTTPTATITPFYLADYDDDHHNVQDGGSIAECSTTEGIDIVAGEGVVSPHNFTEWCRYQTARILTNKTFKRSLLGCILLSSILLGIRTTLYHFNHDDYQSTVLNAILRAFQILFTIESIMKVLYYQKDILDNGWMMLDIFVIASSWLLNNTTLLVILAVRWIKALSKASPVLQLKHIIKALLNSLLKLSMVGLLFGWILYIFAVLFTDLYQRQQLQQQLQLADDGVDYFSRLDKTAMTLFQIMTGGILWSELLSEQQHQDDNSIAGMVAWNLLFVVYVSTALFVFGGLLMAIVFEAVHDSQERLFWKSFQDGRQHKNKNKNASINNNSNKASHHYQPQHVDPVYDAASSFATSAHLEQRIEHLTGVLEQIVRMQKNLQDSIHRLEKEKLAMGERTRSDETG